MAVRWNNPCSCYNYTMQWCVGCVPASGAAAGETLVSQEAPVHVVVSAVVPLLAMAVPVAPPVVSTLVEGPEPPPLLAAADAEELDTADAHTT